MTPIRNCHQSGTTAHRRTLAGAIASGLLALFSASGLPAQTSPPAAAPCSTAEYRQFDFWIGQWDVFRPDGKPAGRSSITQTLDDCVILEDYHGATGYHGQSFNIYDSTRQVWHQTWVDVTGGLLVLEGKFSNGQMVLEGRKAEGTASVRERIVWKPLDGGGVEQIWDESRDEGKTWTVLFDGIYKSWAP